MHLVQLTDFFRHHVRSTEHFVPRIGSVIEKKTELEMLEMERETATTPRRLSTR